MPQKDSADAVIDHAEVIRNLNKNTLQQGKKYYNQVCASCHGMDGASSMPQARSFKSDHFKYGADPFSMWKTITNGVGAMGAQKWLTPAERYAVIQYIREELVKKENPQAYFKVTENYLEGLPEPSKSQEERNNLIKREALAGSQEYGQQYYSTHPGNYGKAIYSQLKGHGNSLLTVELAKNVRLSYNVQRMSIAAAWKGQLDLSETKYQRYRGEGEPEIKGQKLTGLDNMRWSYQDHDDHLEALVSDRTPYPDKWLEYHGHYQHDETIVLSYSIMDRKILEMPSIALLAGSPVIRHTLKIGPGDSWRKLELAGLGGMGYDNLKHGVFPLEFENVRKEESLDEKEWKHPERSLIMSAVQAGEDSISQFVAVGIQGDTREMRWKIEEKGQLSLWIPSAKNSQTIRIHRFSGQSLIQLQNFGQYLRKAQQRTLTDPAEYIRGGERNWEKTIITEGKPDVGKPHYKPVHYGEKDQNASENLVTIPDNYPYVVDRIGLPFENPWNSWIRPSGFDFFEDGRLVMSTYPGDVWLAEEIDKDLNQIRWQRIATGLYDPFGVKVVNAEIYVACRDRIVRLKDLNGDGETDFYETFFADTDVSGVPVQAFNYGLQTDSQGNFLYTKGGQYTNDDEPGHVIRVASDGEKQESVAIGFRAPNGITVGPDDRIFVGDNQGNWMPANKINLIKEGGFYGYLPTIKTDQWGPGPKEYKMQPELARYPDGVLPETFDQPFIWLPQEFDNSPGGGAWTPKKWGPLGNRLVNTSYGKGWAYYLMMQEVDGVTQGAAAALPFQFASGTQRARINPLDGQYYLLGITGWDDSFASKYGSLSRIRYTGGKGFFMVDFKVSLDGLELTFNQKLNKEVAMDSNNYSIEQWNYKWQERYGSAHWSVKNPDKKGHDFVPVQNVRLSDNGKTILLELKDNDLRPVDQLRLIIKKLESNKGELFEDTVYMTILKVPK